MARVHWEMLAAPARGDGRPKLARRHHTSGSADPHPVQHHSPLPPRPSAWRLRALVIGDPEMRGRGSTCEAPAARPSASPVFSRFAGWMLRSRIGAAGGARDSALSDVRRRTGSTCWPCCSRAVSTSCRYAGHATRSGRPSSRGIALRYRALTEARSATWSTCLRSSSRTHVCPPGPRRRWLVAPPSERRRRAGLPASLADVSSGSACARLRRDGLGGEAARRRAVRRGFLRDTPARSRADGASPSARPSGRPAPDSGTAGQPRTLWAAYQHYGDPTIHAGVTGRRATDVSTSGSGS